MSQQLNLPLYEKPHSPVGQSSERMQSISAPAANLSIPSVVKEVISREAVEDVIQLGAMMHAEQYAHLMYVPDCIRVYGEMLLQDFDRDLFNVWIAYRGDEPVGFLIGKMLDYFFSPQRHAQQELWYVVPSNRGTRVSFDLIRAFEDWARVHGAVEIYTGQVNPEAEKGKKISRVLTKIGFPRVGSYHRKITITEN